MDFELTDSQRRLVEAFRAFGEETFTSAHVHQWRRDQGLPDEVAKGFVDLYFGLEDLHDGDQGSSFSLGSQALIIEELSRCAGATLPFQNDLFNLAIMNEFAAEGEFAAVIDEYRSTGRLAFALAISEPEAGSDSLNMQTYTRTVDGRLILNGSKTFVNNGEYAPYIMVAAIDRDEEEPGKYPPMTFWFVPRDLKGITAYPINKIGQSMLPFAQLVFENVELSPEYRMKGRQAGFRQLFRLLEFGRTFTCASSLGMARAAMEDAVAHARARKAFGVQIGRFQQVEQMLVDMEVSICNMRSMLYRAARSVDQGLDDERLSVALMKRYVPNAATEVASDAMQILGGMGYTEHARVSQLWQDCRGNQIAEGTDQIMVHIAAPLILDKY
ncbi:acyl-CoA dehydrogenase family protein [Gordonibacter sp.]|uniref:acyl-CoA dehydrogenase family protein n=3 Tax=Gordonibacter sp. TaxID=1968902 RepID=UPI002FCC7D4B